MLSNVRTTVTLDPDTESVVRRLMAERGLSFKRALNDAIRAGATDRIRSPFATRTKAMGAPAVNLDRALQIAAGEEDEELVRRMRAGQ
jgi:hypothetical protein